MVKDKKKKKKRTTSINNDAPLKYSCILDEGQSHGSKCNKFTFSTYNILSNSFSFHEENLSNINNSYITAKPFPHIQIQNMFLSSFLTKLLNELKYDSPNMTFQFKESDVYRMYQSACNLSSLVNSKNSNKYIVGPYLTKLITMLLSESFRSFIEVITNLPANTLTDQIDCAANCHTQGCHLLYHDDVMNTRCVSYIIYLTEETKPPYSKHRNKRCRKEWRGIHGGQLELYNCKDSTQVIPEKTLLPTWNSIVLFKVQAGMSVHSIQEVFRDDQPRLSIQGWYHAKYPQPNIKYSTHFLLTCKDGNNNDDIPFLKLSDISVSNKGKNILSLTHSDHTFLSHYINSIYLSKSSMKRIRKIFQNQSSIQLTNFLNITSWGGPIHSLTKLIDSKNNVGKSRPTLDYMIGIGNGWTAKGPLSKRRYLRYSKIDQDNDINSDGHYLGSRMSHLQKSLFTSAQYLRWLHIITSLSIPVEYRSDIRRFRPGLDYTIAHHELISQEESLLDCTLCFVDEENNEKEQQQGSKWNTDQEKKISTASSSLSWDLGSVGGYECYIDADDNGSDEETISSDEYIADGNGRSEILSVKASNNTLNIVYRDPGTLKFVKFVGHQALGSRWDIALEYRLDEK